MHRKKLFIVTTVPMSLNFFKGQILALKENFEITLISSPEKLLFQIAAFNKVKNHPVAMKREISLFHDIVSLIKLILYFYRQKPDIVHGNTPKGSFLSMAAAWICRVPSRVYYVHGLRYQGTTGFKRQLLMMMERISCYFATDIIAVSKGVKRLLIMDKIANKKISIIWNGSINGIDLDYFNTKNRHIKNIRPHYQIADDDFVFGFIGRLVGDKGINELVKAFSTINQANTKTKLLLVGSYESLLDPLEQKTLDEIESNTNIINVGIQKDVRSYLHAMDIFVFPSYREGFGIVLIEAGAMNVPSISSDISGCNEIIRDNINGYLIPPRDEKALYEKMIYCLEHKDEIAKMATISRDMIKEKFDQNALWQKIVEKYKRITL